MNRELKQLIILSLFFVMGFAISVFGQSISDDLLVLIGAPMSFFGFAGLLIALFQKSKK